MKGNEWSAKASNGDHYTGAEVTSEGFQIFGLDPYQYYSAGIACYINDNNAMQDNWDRWDNSMDLAGLKNGAIVGWKYFGFGGLDKDTKGCKAFAGTKKGDNTKIHVNLTPGGQACKIHVMLDGPYANSTWNGKEIAVIDVPAAQQPQGGRWGGFGAQAKPVQLSAAVPAVEGLTGKHAIYLVVEGPEIQEPQQQGRFGGQRQQGPQRPRGLMDIHGIGFSKDGVDCVRPTVPTVSISVDGQNLVMNNTPMFSTNQNGYCEVNRYQIYGRLNPNSVIKATATDPSVTFEVSAISAGRAVVTATYKGQKKIYLIN